MTWTKAEQTPLLYPHCSFGSACQHAEPRPPPAPPRKHSARSPRTSSLRSKTVSPYRSSNAQQLPTQLSVRQAATHDRGRPPRPPSPTVTGRPAATPMSERNRSKSLPSSHGAPQAQAPGRLKAFSSLTEKARGSHLDGGHLKACLKQIGPCS